MHWERVPIVGRWMRQWRAYERACFLVAEWAIHHDRVEFAFNHPRPGEEAVLAVRLKSTIAKEKRARTLLQHHPRPSRLSKWVLNQLMADNRERI